MTTRERSLLAALDRHVDKRPDALTSEEVRLYRSLLTKYVSEMSVALMRQTGYVPGMSPWGVGVA